MSSITASTTTAFDVPTLVSQLMGVERRPIEVLNARIASYETRISSFGTLSGLLSSFQTAAKGLNTNLQQLTATPSNPGAFSATASSNAVPGTYAVNVGQLAQSQNLVAAGQVSRSAAISDGSATTITFDFGSISGGTLTNGLYSGATFTPGGGGTASIVIDGTNNTLDGIRDAINAAAVGVSATIVNDGSGTPYRLALTSTDSGVNNSLKITTSGGDGAISNLLGYDPAGTQNLTQTLAAQNANLSVNGIAITSASNTLGEAIQGVTMTLSGVTDSAATLTVARDAPAINTAVAGFVDAYNALASQIKSRYAFGADGADGGPLAGDQTLRLMQDQMRSIFNTPATGGVMTRLSEVGISFQRDGSLQLDGSKLNGAISANFGDVVNLFSSSDGFATRLDNWATSALGAGGLIETRTQSLNDRIKNQNAEVDRLEQRLIGVEKRYNLEYTNLNLLLSSMNSTSTYLTQQLNFTRTSS